MERTSTIKQMADEIASGAATLIDSIKKCISNEVEQETLISLVSSIFAGLHTFFTKIGVADLDKKKTKTDFYNQIKGELDGKTLDYDQYMAMVSDMLTEVFSTFNVSVYKLHDVFLDDFIQDTDIELVNDELKADYKTLMSFYPAKYTKIIVLTRYFKLTKSLVMAMDNCKLGTIEYAEELLRVLNLLFSLKHHKEANVDKPTEK